MSNVCGPYMAPMSHGSRTVYELVDCVTAPVPSVWLQVKFDWAVTPCQSRTATETNAAL